MSDLRKQALNIWKRTREEAERTGVKKIRGNVDPPLPNKRKKSFGK